MKTVREELAILSKESYGLIERTNSALSLLRTEYNKRLNDPSLTHEDRWDAFGDAPSELFFNSPYVIDCKPFKVDLADHFNRGDKINVLELYQIAVDEEIFSAVELRALEKHIMDLGFRYFWYDF